MNRGFIKLARRAFDHYLWTENRSLSKFEAWLDLLQLAAHSPTKRIIRGHVIEIGRGEIVASLRYLGERWRWKKDKVASFLGLIESDQMIRRSTRHTETIVTICNYDRYNDSSGTPPDREPDTGQTDGRHPPDKDKNCKNEKNYTPLPPEGDWQAGFSLEAGSAAPAPKRKRKLTQAEKHRTKHPDLTPTMIRIGSWFGRQPDTLWSVAEFEALQAINPGEREISGMEAYYTADIPPEEDHRRSALYTLLNQWSTDLDRARKHYIKTHRASA